MLNRLWQISCLYVLGLACLVGFLFMDNRMSDWWLAYGLLLVGVGLPGFLTVLLILDERTERFYNHENHNY